MKRNFTQSWSTFVRNHAEGIDACDFMVAVTARFQLLHRTYRPNHIMLPIGKLLSFQRYHLKPLSGAEFGEFYAVFHCCGSVWFAAVWTLNEGR